MMIKVSSIFASWVDDGRTVPACLGNGGMSERDVARTLQTNDVNSLEEQLR